MLLIKQGIYKGDFFQNFPGCEDCKAIAEEFGVPLKIVYGRVWREMDR